MINKIFSGIGFIDKDIGGLYQYGSYLICGEKETGKTVLTSQFLVEGLKKNEMCLLVTGENPGSFINEIQNSLGFDFSLYLKRGLLNILQYERPEGGPAGKLGQYLFEVNAFVSKKGVERVIIDLATMLGMLDEKKIEEHIREFIKFLEKMHITALLLLDKSRAPSMFQVERALINEAVGVFRIEKKTDEKNNKVFYSMKIEKIAGHFPPFPSWDFEIIKKQGVKQITENGSFFYADIKKIEKLDDGG